MFGKVLEPAMISEKEIHFMKDKLGVSDPDLADLLKNSLFRQFLDALSTGISIIGQDGRILFFNDAEYTIFGFDKTKDYAGSKLETLFSSTKSMFTAITTKQKNAHPTISNEGIEGITNRFPIIGKDGEVVCCLVETITTTLEKKRIDELLNTIQLLRQKANFEQKNFSPSYTMHTFDTIVGESESFQKVKEMGKRFARSANPIVIMGESGTGKELIAQALHMASPRAAKPFVAVNCAALPPALVESELFGYAPGAFTGSKHGGMKGKFELADQGTIFLDEIGELPFPMQAKLLRVLESKEIQKIGSASPVYADFRLIAATNQNLMDLVRKNTFREDLYHRLSALELHIPPLRERYGDIPLLADAVKHQIVGQHRAKAVRISNSVLNIFNSYEWTGNIRELKNVLTYAMCCMEDAETLLDVRHLPDRLLNGVLHGADPDSDPQPVVFLDEASLGAERAAILSALRKTKNKSLAAKLLGISRSKLYKKMKQLGL